MRAFLLSKQQPELSHLCGSVGPLKRELLVMGYPQCTFIKNGNILQDDDKINMSDTVYLLPFTSSQFGAYPTENSTRIPTPNRTNDVAIDQDIVEEPLNNNGNALWKFASFGFRLLLLLLIFFRRNPSEITFFYVIGMAAYLGYNHLPLNTLGGSVGSFDIGNNIFTTFFGTLVPGVMDVDPSKLLMEMHAAQQDQDEQEMRMQ